VYNGPCENSITTDTVDILLFPSDEQASVAGADQELCTPDNCATMNATPVTDPATGTWEIISGNASISDYNDPFAEVCDLIVGETVLQWTVYNGPCADTTTSTVTISVFDDTADDAQAGDDIELCWPDNSTTLDGNAPVFPAWGQWTIVSGNCTITDPSSPNTTVTDLEIGTVVLQWYIYNGACGESSDEMAITVFNPESPDADAGEDLFFCDPPSEIQLDANQPIFPAYGTWTQIAGDVTVTFSDVNDPQATTSSPALNESAFVWTVYNGACANGITTDTVWVYVNSSDVADADAGEDQLYCGIQDIVQLDANTAIGLALGTWTIATGDGDFTDIHEEQTTVVDVPLGVNTFIWTIDNGVCGTTTDSVNIVFYNPELPVAFAGNDLNICEHEFTPFNLNGSPADYPASGTWSVIEGPILIDDSTSATSLVLSLGNIITPLVDVPNVIVWTVDNGVCGTTSDTAMIVLEDCLTVIVPDAFSPNGDGTNDFLVIPNIETYPNNRIEIFNRWGMKVFEASPYNNTWDGTSNHSATIGDPLPVSTYYYVLDLGTGEEAFNGFIYLKR
ncbi:MAG: gliding motility-associated C-terminal domain-containing protein, partial [Flavobacteriales bacterium]|nr:gliding motility-associated C-terminal domain-containing protein [Flavobacteriales bacterium]